MGVTMASPNPSTLPIAKRPRTGRKRRRKKELEPEIVQGRIGKDDERYHEYLQLVNDLGGQGLKGEGKSAS